MPKVSFYLLFCLVTAALFYGCPLPGATAHGAMLQAAPDGFIQFLPDDHYQPRLVPKLGMVVSLAGNDRVSPTGRAVSASGWLHFSRNGQPFAQVRIYDDSCFITPIRIGGAPFIEIESKTGGTGVDFRTHTFISPEGVALNVFDASWVQTKSHEQDDRLLFLWNTEDGTRYRTLIGRNAIHTICQDTKSSFDWNDLRTVTASYVDSRVFDNNTMHLRFRQEDGRTLELRSFGRDWLDWLASHPGQLRLTYGRCRFDTAGATGEDTFLYDAMPAFSTNGRAGQTSAPPARNTGTVAPSKQSGTTGQDSSFGPDENEKTPSAQSGETASEAPDLVKLRKAADAGDAAAANKLGVWHEKGRHGLPMDPKQAVRWYTRAAEAGNGLALHNLGDCYRDGVGVEANLHTAFEYYLKAAATGLPLGYEDVGDSLLNNNIAEGFILEGKEQRETAARWYRKAAAQGRASARNKLKQMGLPVDTPKALAPLPVCPSVDMPGKRTASGIWLKVTSPRTADAYGFLIRTAAGHLVDVIMGNGDYPEFMNVSEGDSVTLTYTSSRGLDVDSAECVTTHYYLPDSGKIIQKAR